MTRVKTEKRMVREADLVAEVTIELEFTDHEWSPFIKPADVEKLDSARRALRRGDIHEAAKYGTVFRLTKVGAA
jgi:hypothetical protein